MSTFCLTGLGQSVETPAKPAAPPVQDGSHSQVLFQRSAPDAPSNATVDGPETAPVAGEVEKPVVRDIPAKVVDPAAENVANDEREAITFTAYDLDIRLFAEQQNIAVRARLVLRNDGKSAIRDVRLQLSSTLNWERVSIGGKTAAFKSESLKSDADHTGLVNEAVISLATPLEPGGVLSIDAVYSGQIALSARRLQDIGAPTDVAQRYDWDELSDDIVALRGFGNVLWYPASALPVELGDGAKYFTEVGRQKLRQSEATFKAVVTEEFVGQAPNLAVINGRVEAVTVTAPPADAYPGVVTCAVAARRLGFLVPSLFLMARQESDGEDLQVYAADRGAVGVQNYLAADAAVSPVIHRWLGGRPKVPLAVIDLPETGDAPFETGAAVLVSLGPAAEDRSADVPTGKDGPGEDTQKIAAGLSHALSHAYFESPRPWLSEGVAQFVGNEWLAQSKGREAALEASESQRNALALAEPGSPREGQGVSLLAASDPVYYRTKASYVLGMLRDIAGEDALASALRGYVAAEDVRPDYFEGLVEKASGKDLKWFFQTWVYQDLSLPDFSIARVFPSRSSEPRQYLVAIDVANDGYAEAEVPVTLRSKETTLTERIRVPGRGKVTHRMILRGEPTEVQVNDGTVPEVQAAIHRESIRMSGGN